MLPLAFSLSMPWIIGLSVAAVILLGILLWWIRDRVDDSIDEFQLRVNKLENEFAKAGANWMSEMLALVVVGDEEKLLAKIAELVEAQDIALFFLDNVAIPCALHSIRTTAENYPERWAKILDAMEAAKTARALRKQREATAEAAAQ